MAKGLTKLTRMGEYYGSCLILTGVSLIANRGLGTIDRVLLLLALLFINIFCFAINDVEDADDDAKDPKKVLRNPISSGEVKRGLALAFTLLTGIISLVLLVKFGFFTILAGSLALFLGFIYSYKKIRLKSVPFLDLLSHGLFLGGLQTLIVITANGNIVNLPGLSLIILVFIGSAMGDVNNEIRDYKVDRATGIKNTASILNLVRFEPLMHFLAVVPYGILAVIAFINTTAISRNISLVVATIIGLYYLFAYAIKRRRGFYDLHGQKIIALFGLILVLFG